MPTGISKHFCLCFVNLTSTSSMLALDTHKTNAIKNIYLYAMYVGMISAKPIAGSHTYKASLAKGLHGMNEREGWPYYIL